MIVINNLWKTFKLDESVMRVVNLRQENIASAKQKLAGIIGGFLPYLFIIFLLSRKHVSRY